MLNEFKKFLFRGNVIDLAVGVVIGGAFNGFVGAIVSDVLSPLITAVARVPDFSNYAFNILGGHFAIGHLINQLISFVLVAFAVFFFVVRPVNILAARAKKGETIEPDTKKCPECLSDIPLAAKRCKFCGSAVENTAPVV